MMTNNFKPPSEAFNRKTFLRSKNIKSNYVENIAEKQETLQRRNTRLHKLGLIRQGTKIDIKKEYKINYLDKILEEGEGYDFGHLALINSKPRAATVIATKPCNLAVLNKEAFSEILEKHKKKQKDK